MHDIGDSDSTSMTRFLGPLGPHVGHRLKLFIASLLLCFGSMFSGDLLGAKVNSMFDTQQIGFSCISLEPQSNRGRYKGAKGEMKSSHLALHPIFNWGLISVPQVMMDEGSWILSCLVFILYGILATLEHMTLDSPSNHVSSNLSLHHQDRLSLRRAAASKKSPVPFLGMLGFVTVLTIAAYNASFEYLYFPEPVLNTLNPLATMLLSFLVRRVVDLVKNLQSFHHRHEVPDGAGSEKDVSLFHNTPIRLRFFAFLLTSVALGIMTFPGHKLMSHGSSPSTGLFLTILTSIGIGSIATLQELAVVGYGLSPAEVISHSSLFAAMVILIGLVLSGSLVSSFEVLASQDPESRPAGVFWVAAIGYCVTRVYFAILIHYGAAIAISCAAASEAFFRLLLKVFLLAEPLMLRYIWSGMAIIIGLYLATSSQSNTLSKKPKNHRRQHSSLTIA